MKQEKQDWSLVQYSGNHNGDWTTTSIDIYIWDWAIKNWDFTTNPLQGGGFRSGHTAFPGVFCLSAWIQPLPRGRWFQTMMATAWVVEMNKDDMSFYWMRMDDGWWNTKLMHFNITRVTDMNNDEINLVLFLKSGFFTHLISSPIIITFYSRFEPKSIGRSTPNSGRTSAARSLQSWIPLGATGRHRRRFAPSTSTGGAAGYGIAQLFDYGISTYIDIYRHITVGMALHSWYTDIPCHASCNRICINCPTHINLAVSCRSTVWKQPHLVFHQHLFSDQYQFPPEFQASSEVNPEGSSGWKHWCHACGGAQWTTAMQAQAAIGCFLSHSHPELRWCVLNC